MGDSRVILNVEDNPPARFLRTRILERAGYGVAEADTAAAALARAREASLLLLDVGLPDMDGFTLCERIKAVSPNVPVVMITSVYRTTEARRDAFAAGASAFLLEPVDSEKLVQTVDGLTRRTPTADQAVEEEAWIVTDAVGVIHEISPSAAALLNLSVRGARGRNLPSYFIENRPRLLHDLLRASEGAIVERVTTMQPRDRRARRVHMDLSSVPESGRNVHVRWVLALEPR